MRAIGESKPNSTNRTLTTTLADDPDLTLPFDAFSNYHFEMLLAFSTGGGGIRIGFNAFASIDANFCFYFRDNTSVTALQTAEYINNNMTAVNQAITDAGGTPQFVRLQGMINTDATSGNITLQWAQENSNANATTLLFNSYFSRTPIT